MRHRQDSRPDRPPLVVRHRLGSRPGPSPWRHPESSAGPTGSGPGADPHVVGRLPGTGRDLMIPGLPSAPGWRDPMIRVLPFARSLRGKWRPSTGTCAVPAGSGARVPQRVIRSLRILETVLAERGELDREVNDVGGSGRRPGAECLDQCEHRFVSYETRRTRTCVWVRSCRRGMPYRENVMASARATAAGRNAFEQTGWMSQSG